MNPHTYASLLDELEKIAEGPNEQINQQVAVNSSLHPLDQQRADSSFEQKLVREDGKTESKTVGQLAKEYAARIRRAAQKNPLAREANGFFGLPLDVPARRGVRRYEQGSSAAASPDRSQSPVDAQSTANISAGNKMSPATGPGGV